MEFSKKLKELRRQKKITQENLAKIIGVERSSIGKYEASNVMPSIDVLGRIADYFGVSVDFLLGKEKTPGIEPNAVFLEEKNIYMIPLFETVSAGLGEYAQNSIIDYVPLYITSQAEAQETMCLRVHGDSMYPKIEDGDIIQVYKQSSVDSGTIAVVLLDGEEGLVKRVEYGADWIELHSINPMYKTMRFEGRDVLRLEIIGAVKKIIKNV